MNAKNHRHARTHNTQQRALLVAGIVAAVLLVANVALWGLYKNRTYPRTSVMNTTIGSIAYGSLRDTISKQNILPEEMVIAHGEKRETVRLADLGISTDIGRAVESANEQRSWLPMFNLFKSPKLKAPITFDQNKLRGTSEKLTLLFTQAAGNATLNLNGGNITIAEEQDGYKLEADKLQAAITEALDRGNTVVDAPTAVLEPKVTIDDLQDDKSTLEKQLEVSVAFTYNGQTKRPNRLDKADWYVRSGATYRLDHASIAAYITRVGDSFDITVKDSGAAANKAKQALEARKATTITLTKQTALRTFRYCTNVRGVSASALPSLQAKLRSTYGDVRGWSLGGKVAFKEVNSGCDFTVWLSASSQMTSFGGVCDPVWSCRSGDNVVLNYTRWMNASPAWNANGGTLEEYRNMLINHETGHRLGFAHRYCGGAGQPAPVMQQQSINLQGCVFSAWPNASERATLAQSLGI
jgi:hypothetical protein